jgi:ATP synthase mitochondrial F1 complex assembly factor 2
MRGDDCDDLNTSRKEKWNPLIAWFENSVGAKVFVGDDSFVSFSQNPEAIEAVRKIVDSFDCWTLAAYESSANFCHSFILAHALALGHISASETASLARVEEDYQSHRWGLVQGGHDVDDLDLRARITAVEFFLNLTKHESVTSK